MKKVISLMLALLLLSLCACGSGEEVVSESSVVEAPVSEAVVQETPAPESVPLSEADQAAVDMASDAVRYLKTQLLYPESFKLTSVAYISSLGDTTFKIVFSSKNSYGGELDLAAYFTYNETEKVFADLYQSTIDLAEAQGKLDAVQNAQAILAGTADEDAGEADATSVYIEKAYFLEASEFAGTTYAIYENNATTIDISLIK